MDQKTETGGIGSFLLVIVQIIAAFIQEGKGRLPELGNLCLIGCLLYTSDAADD